MVSTLKKKEFKLFLVIKIIRNVKDIIIDYKRKGTGKSIILCLKSILNLFYLHGLIFSFFSENRSGNKQKREDRRSETLINTNKMNNSLNQSSGITMTNLTLQHSSNEGGNYDFHSLPIGSTNEYMSSNVCTANSNGRKCLAWACKVRFKNI